MGKCVGGLCGPRCSTHFFILIGHWPELSHIATPIARKWTEAWKMSWARERTQTLSSSRLRPTAQSTRNVAKLGKDFAFK